jgi:hypothetical protein
MVQGMMKMLTLLDNIIFFELIIKGALADNFSSKTALYDCPFIIWLKESSALLCASD